MSGLAFLESAFSAQAKSDNNATSFQLLRLRISTMNGSSFPCGAVNPNYRCALVLNNIGLKLLSTHCYQQGLETLKDATALIKATFYPTSATARVDLDQKIQQAHQRLANPQVSCHSAMQVRRLAHGNLDQDTLYAVLSENTSTSFPIWIEQDYLSETGSPEFESAIILFNTAIAYLCMSKVPTFEGSKLALKYHNGALRLLQISQSILMRLLSESNDQPVHLLEILNVTTVVLHMLVTAWEESAKDKAQGKHFCLLLQRLRHAGADIEGELLGLVSRAAAAA
jgi:hypothetical protein